VPRKTPDKQALLPALADHVLENGLNSASLRPMAAAAGTSDRMLIYHFGSKDAMIGALLAFLADRMAMGLDAAVPERRFETEAALVREIIGLMRSDRFRPYIRVWLDIVSAAAQGSAIHREAGHRILALYLDWLARRHPEGERGASLALTLVEGALVMDAVGHEAVADAAGLALGRRVL
jgi:AcrR family transcriptional regulator